MSNKVVDKAYLKCQFQNFYSCILLCCFPKINDTSSSTTSTYSSCKVDELLACKANTDSLCAVAFSGCYSDLIGTPQTLDSATYDSCGCVISDTYASNVCRMFDDATCSCHTFLKSPSGCIVGCVDDVNWAECACCASYDDSGNYISNTYIRCYDLCSVATSGQYCDLSGAPTCLSELTNDCGYTSCTGTVTGINLYNNGTCVCTLDNSTALCLGCNAFTNTAYITASDSITGNAETASCATCDGVGNEICATYATKNELATHTATFRGSFATWADVPICSTGYCCNYAGCCAPSPNDYMVVQDATGYCASCVGQYRFKYTAETWDDASGASCKCYWAPEYRINEVLDTAVTQGSSNGVTSGAVYNAIPTDNCQLGNTCGYTTCTGTVTGINVYCNSSCICTINNSTNLCLGIKAFSNTTIPTDNCQLGNTCGYTTCTGTVQCGCCGASKCYYMTFVINGNMYWACTAGCNVCFNPSSGLMIPKCLCTTCALIIPIGTSNATDGAIWITSS